MKLIWRKPILKYTDGEEAAVFNFYHTQFVWDGRAVLFYSFFIEDKIFRQVFAASVFDLKSGENERFLIKFKKGTGVPAPCCWKITESDCGYLIDPFAYFAYGDNPLRKFCLFFDGKSIEKIKRKKGRERRISFQQKTFEFGNLRVKIAENATRKLECTNIESGERLWTFTVIGYLYTDISEYDGIIYFGTAGQGGRFYGLNLLSGEVIHEVNTHGTSRYTRYNNKFYFDGSGYLLEYSPESKNLSSFSFGKGNYVSYEVNILACDGKLYAVVAERVAKNQDAYAYNYTLACVEP